MKWYLKAVITIDENFGTDENTRAYSKGHSWTPVKRKCLVKYQQLSRTTNSKTNKLAYLLQYLPWSFALWISSDQIHQAHKPTHMRNFMLRNLIQQTTFVYIIQEIMEELTFDHNREHKAGQTSASWNWSDSDAIAYMTASLICQRPC